MSEVSGIVQDIQTKSVAGGKTAYNIVVGGQSYGAGLYAPKCKVGDFVTFGVDESRGYKNVERNTLKSSANKPANYVEPETPKAAPAKSGGSPYDARQDAISRQAASNTAIGFLTLLQSAGALPLPAKKGDMQVAMDALLKKQTEFFYEQNTGVKWKDIGPTKDEESDDTSDDSDPADENWA